jgi:hypothetical protein
MGHLPPESMPKPKTASFRPPFEERRLLFWFSGGGFVPVVDPWLTALEAVVILNGFREYDLACLY